MLTLSNKTMCFWRWSHSTVWEPSCWVFRWYSALILTLYCTFPGWLPFFSLSLGGVLKRWKTGRKDETSSAWWPPDSAASLWNVFGDHFRYKEYCSVWPVITSVLLKISIIDTNKIIRMNQVGILNTIHLRNANMCRLRLLKRRVTIAAFVGSLHCCVHHLCHFYLLWHKVRRKERAQVVTGAYIGAPVLC